MRIEEAEKFEPFIKRRLKASGLYIGHEKAKENLKKCVLGFRMERAYGVLYES